MFSFVFSLDFLYFCTQFMSTIIYPSPIFGPVHSRRLGISLGINLMPADGKVCTFNCIYCECGFNEDHRPKLPRPTRTQVAEALENKLQEMKEGGELPDVLTFAGNGEPTAHPHFAEIIDDTIRLRDQYCPNAKVSVLSNATFVHKPEVHDALMRVDNNIQKLDTVDPDYIQRVDRPTGHYDVRDVIEGLKAFRGHVIIQTMFMKSLPLTPSHWRGDSEAHPEALEASYWRGDSDAHPEALEASPNGGRMEGADNTGEEFVGPWLEAVKEIQPQEVMVYTIDRETPMKGLQKATHEELDAIRDRVIAAGIPCQASY